MEIGKINKRLMLVKDFYKIDKSEKTENEWIYEIELNPKHQVYEGHFPSQPVVPGVCSVQMVKECAEQALNAELNFVNIQNCKYSAMVIPSVNQKLIIKLSISENEDNNYNLKATILNEETTFLSLKAILTKQ